FLVFFSTTSASLTCKGKFGDMVLRREGSYVATPSESSELPYLDTESPVGTPIHRDPPAQFASLPNIPGGSPGENFRGIQPNRASSFPPQLVGRPLLAVVEDHSLRINSGHKPVDGPEDGGACAPAIPLREAFRLSCSGPTRPG
ncbi:unnamed protein product, partial [Polarella glacialis]